MAADFEDGEYDGQSVLAAAAVPASLASSASFSRVSCGSSSSCFSFPSSSSDFCPSRSAAAADTLPTTVAAAEPQHQQPRRFPAAPGNSSSDSSIGGAGCPQLYVLQLLSRQPVAGSSRNRWGTGSAAAAASSAPPSSLSNYIDAAALDLLTFFAKGAATPVGSLKEGRAAASGGATADAEGKNQSGSSSAFCYGGPGKDAAAAAAAPRFFPRKFHAPFFSSNGGSSSSLFFRDDAPGTTAAAGETGAADTGIHWPVVKYVAGKLAKVLEEEEALHARPELLVAAALLAWKRDMRALREEQLWQQLKFRRSRGVYVHSSMTDVHTFYFDTTKQRFCSTPLQPLPLTQLGKQLCDSSVFANMYNRRYYVLQQRCLLHPLLVLQQPRGVLGGGRGRVSNSSSNSSRALGGAAADASVLQQQLRPHVVKEETDEQQQQQNAKNKKQQQQRWKSLSDVFARNERTAAGAPNRRTVVVEVDAASRRPQEQQLLLGTLGRNAEKELTLQGLFSEVGLKFRRDCLLEEAFFLEGHTLLLDGCFHEDGLFHVSAAAHPPRWPAADRLSLKRASSAAEQQHQLPRPSEPLPEREAFILRQQGSAMFGGMLSLRELDALEEWEKIEEERERDVERMRTLLQVGEGSLQLLQLFFNSKTRRRRDGSSSDDLVHAAELPKTVATAERQGTAADAGPGGQGRAATAATAAGTTGGSGSAAAAAVSEAELTDLIAAATAENVEALAWVIISQCHFDDPQDLVILDKLFTGFIDQRPLPSGFVFLGGFASGVCTAEEGYSSGFDALLSLLTNKFPVLLARCCFVFVPGPTDPSFIKESLPRLPLTPPLTANFQQRAEAAVPACKGKIFFSTSPCRIRHFTSSMLFFSHDIFKSLSRDAIFAGNGDEVDKRGEEEEMRQQQGDKKGETAQEGNWEKTSSLDTHIAAILYNTVVGQAHLCPSVADHRLLKHRDESLNLFPMPDLVFICDRSAPPFVRTNPEYPNEFIFANAENSFRQTKTFFVYDSRAHTLEKLLVP